MTSRSRLLGCREQQGNPAADVQFATQDGMKQMEHKDSGQETLDQLLARFKGTVDSSGTAKI